VVFSYYPHTYPRKKKCCLLSTLIQYSFTENFTLTLKENAKALFCAIGDKIKIGTHTDEYRSCELRFFYVRISSHQVWVMIPEFQLHRDALSLQH
jgi:hypothetical protein